MVNSERAGGGSSNDGSNGSKGGIVINGTAKSDSPSIM